MQVITQIYMIDQAITLLTAVQMSEQFSRGPNNLKQPLTCCNLLAVVLNSRKCPESWNVRPTLVKMERMQTRSAACCGAALM